MIVPEKIYRLKLTSTEINVYQYLCSRANKQGECFPSQTTIAKAVNMNRSTVNQAIKRLEGKKLLINSAGEMTAALPQIYTGSR